MAITISGQNNNDKILASDGVLDSISGFNVVGVLTATTFETTAFNANHINVGSSIQLGNAGIITATTLIGNVTGNVNSTSNLLLQISGSEKFRVGNGGQLGIGGANYGTSGQVLTSGGSSSAATWSTISGTTINNNAANKVIMGSNTANTLEAVAKSSLFSQINHGQSFLDDNYLIFGDASDLQLVHQSSGAKARIRNTNDSGSLDIESTLTRFTNKDGSTEKLRIDSSGRVLIGTNSSRNVGGSTTNSKLQIEGTSTNTSSMSLVNNENSTAAPFVFFGKTRGNSAGESGIVQSGDTLGGLSFIGADSVDTNNRTAEITAVVNGTPANNTIPTDLVFSTSTANAGQLAERLRITSTGQLLLMSNTGYNPSSSLLSLATDASAAANMLSDSSSIYNHNNPAFVHVQNMNNTGDGQEAGIILHSKSSFGGAWAIYGKRTTSSFKSDLIFRGRTGQNSSAEKLRITSTGIVNAPSQAGFYARMQNTKSSVMGGGASYYTVPFDTDSGSICYDTHNSYNTSNGLYTVPTGGTGYYMLATAICLSNNVYGRGGEFWFIQGSNRYFFDRRFMSNAGSGTITGFYGSSIIYLSAGQSIGVQGFISGGNQNVDVQGAAATDQITWFTARKIA